MALDLLVSKIMSSQPITVPTQARLSGVRGIMSKHNLHHVPVVDGRRLMGVVSSTDLLRLLPADVPAGRREVDKTLDEHSLVDVMTKDVVTVAPEDPIRKAIDLLQTGNVHSLPVLDGTELVGILTTTDLLKYLAAELDRTIREL